MRKMRLTLFLIIANIAVFFAILSLEFSEVVVEKSQRPLVEITRLEVYGKNLAKPRIVEFIKNKWEILSPVKWEANSFAVNRILRNLEFLDDEVGFPAEDLALREQSLADYGLADPICTFNYGNDKLMYFLKIGNSASVGDKVYMLDSLENKIIVADSQVVEALMVDIDRLRSQNVISIPKFEISSVTLRLPVKDLKTQAKSSFRRVRLNKGLDGAWIFEAPFVAEASNKAVDAFLASISSAYIKSFDDIGEVEAGLDPLSFPISITFDSTSRSQTLFLGHLNKDTHTVYAKLADNPTIFSLDSYSFENLETLQTDLRAKNIMKISEHSCNYIEISSPESIVSLKKLSNNTWDISAKIGDKLTELSSADLTKINSLLATLNNTTARVFVSDMKNEDLSKYGLAKPALRISLGFDNSTKKTLLIGNSFKQGVVTLYYTKLEGEDSIYAISGELINNYKANALDYRSKLLYSLPENAKILSIEILNFATKEALLTAKAVDGSFSEYISKMLPEDKDLFEKLLVYSKTLYVKNYVLGVCDNDSCVIDSKDIPWAYELNISISMPGTGGDEISQETILFSNRLGANLQYGFYNNEIFELVDTMINSLYFLGISSMPVQAKKND